MAAIAGARETNMIIRFLKRLMYGGSHSLRAYEVSCLNCLRRFLAPEAQRILDLQIGAVEIVQRFADDKLVTLHLAKGAQETTRLFPNREPELYVARMSIARERERSVTCEFVFHEGRISSLEFSRPPRGVSAESVTCVQVDLLADLMTPPEAALPAISDGKVLETIRTSTAIKDVIAPASRKERDAFMKRLAPVVVPDDYSALLRETNGFVADGWRFYGTKARKLILPNHTYFVMAERTDGRAALCLGDGEPSRRIVLYDEIDDSHEPAGDQFLDALLRVVRATGE